MDEFQFIDSIKQKYYKQPSVIKGIGDDAAILRHTDEDTIVAMDTMVDEIHFSKKTTEPFHIGYRVLAANISDIAAMGGKPTSYLVSIAIPKSSTLEQLHEIYEGMSALADCFQMDLIGGDTVSSNVLTITVTVIGTVKKDRVRYRSDAKIGDDIFVTGTLGDAACGLDVLLNERDNLNKYTDMIDRHRMPMPRVTFANACQTISRLSLNDISDGISSEANEIANASKVCLNINYEAIPKHHLLQEFSKEKVEQWVLSGGEDFELVGTVAKSNWDQLVTIAEQTNTKVTKIGTVEEDPTGNGVVLLSKENQTTVLNKSGYTHLRG
jgi:thiamine-monophosphate kinase